MKKKIYILLLLLPRDFGVSSFIHIHQKDTAYRVYCRYIIYSAYKLDYFLNITIYYQVEYMLVFQKYYISCRKQFYINFVHGKFRTKYIDLKTTCR
jgi:hypothetical protein